MTLPVWAPSTFYSPGSTVRPLTVPAIVSTPIANAAFEDGNVEWTTEAGWSIVTQQGGEPPFQGSRYAMFSGSGAAEGRIVSQTIVPVRVGQKIIASCQVRRKRTSYTGGRVEIDWLDENDVLIFSSQGNTIETTGSTTGNWRKSEVEAFAPAGAAKARVAGFAYRTQGSHSLFLDSFTWDYAFTPEGEGLVFTAVQPASGFSAGTEPVWPTVNGQQVVDNEVIWEAIEGTRVVWEANPIIVSGYFEPEWPLQVGSDVSDGSAIWTAVSRRVTDPKCPNTPIVAIGSSKVFCGDDDIVGFSATVNPLDWSAEDDAGYLPFGLQTFGAMPVTAMGLYRGNLAVFNSQGYQMWQIGEDPETHALLDAGPIGCVWPRTPLAVMNDLVFLSAVGIRNIGVAGASTNLQVGNFGQQIDPLVIAKLQSAEFEPFSLYVPAFGQYWCFFGDEAFVLTVNGNKQMSWSRYTFPEEVTDWTLDGDDLVLRTASHKVWRVDADTLDDDHYCASPEPLVITAGEILDGGFTAGFGYTRNYTNLDDAGTLDSGEVPTCTIVGIWDDDDSPPSRNFTIRLQFPVGVTPTDDLLRTVRCAETGVVLTHAELTTFTVNGQFGTWLFSAGNPLGLETGETYTIYLGMPQVGLYDFPYRPELLEAGTLVVDANYVRDRTSGTGGNFVPDSYGGNPVVFDPPAYALVFQAMNPGAGDLVVAVNGLDENGAPVTETITFDADTKYRYIVGTQLFSQINSVDQSGITGDQFFSVGYQRFVADEEAGELTVTMHGFWTIANSSDPASNNGLFTGDGFDPLLLPATSVLVVRHNINDTTTERVYAEDVSGASVTLPAGAPGRIVVGTEELDSIWFIDRTGSGGTTPFVDLGIQFTIPMECEGEEIVGLIQWPHLDLGSFGVEKQFIGFDLVATAPEGVNVSIGYDQRDLTRRTADYLMEADSLPGKLVPIPVTAPSFDLRLTFEPGQRWEWNAACLYIQDRRPGS